MVDHTHRQGLEMGLMMNAEVPPTTVITSKNDHVLFTRQSKKFIVDLVGRRLKRKLSGNEIRLVIDFANRLSPVKYWKMTYRKSVSVMANDFIIYYQKDQTDPDKSRVLGDKFAYDEMEYLYKDENMMKRSLFPKLLDYREETEKKDTRRRDLIQNMPTPTKDEVQKSVVIMSNAVQHMASNSVREEFLTHLRGMNTTYQSVSAPRQTLVLDSRNRNVPNSTIYDISWNINMSDNNGRKGDVRIKFPIQQVIRMTCYNFWIWLGASAVGDTLQYNPAGLLSSDTPPKIRIFIKEMPAQCVQISIPRGIQQNLEIINYHFEADVVDSTADVTNNQVFLQPNNNYTFQRPLSEIDTLTVQFYRDTYQIPIMPDNFTFTRITKVSNIVTFSGASGDNANTYKRIIYADNPNYLTLPVVWPTGIGNLVDLSKLLYKALIHVADLTTPYADVNALLNSPNGLSVGIYVQQFNDNYTQNDEMSIDVSNTSLATIGDFDIEVDYTVFIDAFAFTMPIEFICLEMPPNGS